MQEKALPQGNYNEKIKLSTPPQVWFFPDFILTHEEGPTESEKISVFTGKTKTILHKFKMAKDKDKRYKFWLDVSGKYLTPIVFDNKPFLFETGSSRDHGKLSHDEFVVRLPTEEELTGPHHIHFLG